jgi:hypothetical protein
VHRLDLLGFAAAAANRCAPQCEPGHTRDYKPGLCSARKTTRTLTGAAGIFDSTYLFRS